MEEERKSFVYGNPEQKVSGCLSLGISEQVANKIFDEMMDFAKYAFNKSHAAAYAVVAYQTAYLKCYYPLQFMAALMTSVIDNPAKVTEYIYSTKQMGIRLLPPDVNESGERFTVSDGCIRYSLSAIKGLGSNVVSEITAVREEGGRFKDLKDFILRLSNKEANRRTIESFIKAGALDSLPGNRRQQMMVYLSVLDEVAREKKQSLSGQMSLFDFADDELKESMRRKLPEVPEYTREEILAFEKEVLGFYVSGHPLEAYEGLLKKNITATTTDFVLDEETGAAKVLDGQTYVIGGIITAKTTKTTRSNSIMAFLTVEDTYGTVEVLVFPKDYERSRQLLNEDTRVLIKGRASAEDDKDAKLIFQDLTLMSEVPRELWIKFPDKTAYMSAEEELFGLLAATDGRDSVSIFCEAEHAVKKLPPSRTVAITEELLLKLKNRFGDDSVKITDKALSWRERR